MLSTGIVFLNYFPSLHNLMSTTLASCPRCSSSFRLGSILDFGQHFPPIRTFSFFLFLLIFFSSFIYFFPFFFQKYYFFLSFKKYASKILDFWGSKQWSWDLNWMLIWEVIPISLFKVKSSLVHLGETLVRLVMDSLKFEKFRSFPFHSRT